MESWLQTYSGQVVDLFNPDPGRILIEDIAHALAHSCRYGGHSKDFYSVAQHSVHVSGLCTPENALWGLLHDAAEAYLTDIPAPLKQHLPDYRSFERRFETLIAQVFGLPVAIPEEVRMIDRQMLRIEHRDVMHVFSRPWAADDLPLMITEITSLWEPTTAKAAFLERFQKLTNGDRTREEKTRKKPQPPINSCFLHGTYLVLATTQDLADASCPKCRQERERINRETQIEDP